MASVASQLIEEVTAHTQSNSLDDAREICADGTYIPNNLRNKWHVVEFYSSYSWNFPHSPAVFNISWHVLRMVALRFLLLFFLYHVAHKRYSRVSFLVQLTAFKSVSQFCNMCRNVPSELLRERRDFARQYTSLTPSDSLCLSSLRDQGSSGMPWTGDGVCLS